MQPLPPWRRWTGCLAHPAPPPAWGGGVPKEPGFLQREDGGGGGGRRTEGSGLREEEAAAGSSGAAPHSEWPPTPRSRRFPKRGLVPGCGVASLTPLSAQRCPLQGGRGRVWSRWALTPPLSSGPVGCGPAPSPRSPSTRPPGPPRGHLPASRGGRGRERPMKAAYTPGLPLRFAQISAETPARSLPPKAASLQCPLPAS